MHWGAFLQGAKPLLWPIIVQTRNISNTTCPIEDRTIETKAKDGPASSFIVLENVFIESKLEKEEL